MPDMSESEMVSPVCENGPDAAYIMLRTALNRFGKVPSELDGNEQDEVTRMVERECAMRAAVLASPEAEGVSVGDEAIGEALSELESRYDSREAFLNDLARNGLNLQGLRQAVADELKVDTVLARVSEETPQVSDADVRAYYDDHLDRFIYPETREVRHILVTINDDIPENCRENALKRISQIAWRIKRRPHRFAEQAMKHSECPTALQEGKLGRVPKDKLFPELDAVLFSMQEGEISDPVESELGFHLIYCEKIYAGGEMSFEEAAPRIRNLLQKQSGRRHQRAWLAACLQR